MDRAADVLKRDCGDVVRAQLLEGFRGGSAMDFEPGEGVTLAEMRSAMTVHLAMRDCRRVANFVLFNHFPCRRSRGVGRVR